jgi:O-antigen/teichoic acid export membrane protein
MLREGLPFWLAGLCALAYSRGDVVILRLLAGDAEVGAYRAAGQLFEVTKNLPLLVLTALFPQLARDFRQSRARLRRAERMIGLGLLAAGLVVGALLAGAAGLVARRIFGPEFTRAIPALRILSLALPLLFLNFGLTHFLVARDLGMLNLAFSALMVAVNVTANLMLSRRLGASGAAWATLATEAALSICCLCALRAARRQDRDGDGDGDHRGDAAPGGLSARRDPRGWPGWCGAGPPDRAPPSSGRRTRGPASSTRRRSDRCGRSPARGR